MTAEFNIAPAGFTRDTHPLRNVKPDPWMLRNARATVDALARYLADHDYAAPSTTPRAEDERTRSK